MVEATSRGDSPPSTMIGIRVPNWSLTAAAVVRRIYTDLAVIDVTAEGLILRELVEDIDLPSLQAKTEAALHAAPDLRGTCRSAAYITSRHALDCHPFLRAKTKDRHGNQQHVFHEHAASGG